MDDLIITSSTSEDKLEVIPLGAGMEVGRSAVLVKFRGKTVLFDCGVHPAYTGLASLPFFDNIDPSEIDLCLVSHFHLDHCGAVPYLINKTNFKGKCYMTHPTKAIYKLLLSDFVKVSNQSDQLYNEQDLMKSLDKIDLIGYHQEMEHNGIKFWCYNAGHVLGAAMFMIDIGGTTVLYTGDFSRQEDRHLLGAETPTVKPDVLIIESTYGIQVHEKRKDREQRFTKMVHDVVLRGGRCLIPVFALGRAQELLLILDEYWETHPKLQKIPIYYASSLAQKCMKVFKQYIESMNEKIRKQFDISNPFLFKHISNLKDMDSFEDSSACFKKGTLVLMSDGTQKKIEDIKKGESVLGPDLKPRKVINLIEPGLDNFYHVVERTRHKKDTIEKLEYVCNSRHLLSVTTPMNSNIYPEKGNYKNSPCFCVEYFKLIDNNISGRNIKMVKLCKQRFFYSKPEYETECKLKAENFVKTLEEKFEWLIEARDVIHMDPKVRRATYQSWVPLHTSLIGDKGFRCAIQKCGFEPLHIEKVAWLFGLWVGDGTSTRPIISVDIRDLDEYERLKSYGSDLGLDISDITQTDEKSFSGKVYLHSSMESNSEFQKNLTKHNNFWDLIRYYNMGTSGTKCVPSTFQIEEVIIREWFLAGLIDSDGHLCFNSNKEDSPEKYRYVVIPTISLDVCKGLVSLCRSLGIHTSVSIADEHKDKRDVQHKMAYYIQLGACSSLTNVLSKCSIERKKMEPPETIDYSPRKFYFDITKIKQKTNEKKRRFAEIDQINDLNDQDARNIIKKWSNDLILEILRDNSQFGLSLIEICDKFSCKHTTLKNYLRGFCSQSIARNACEDLILSNRNLIKNDTFHEQDLIDTYYGISLSSDTDQLFLLSNNIVVHNCVVMASPGMLQSGISQELFEKWCSDARNGVVIPGYCVEGTLAKRIITEPAEITLSSGQTVPLNMTVKSISFSAHSDREQTEEFIEAAKPSHCVLVHGDSTNMTRLKQALQSKFEKLQVYTPKNCQSVEIMFRGEKIAKVFGKLTEQVKDGEFISGILVQKEFKNTLVKKEDLKSQTEITYTGVTQNLTIPKPDFDFEKALKERFTMTSEKGENYQSFKIGDHVKIIFDIHDKNEQITLEWNTSVENDLIADSVLQILLGSKQQIHSATEVSLMQTVYLLLSERFKEIEFDTKTVEIHLIYNNTKVIIDKNGKVKGTDDEKVITGLNVYLRRIFMSLFPLPTLDEVTCQDMLIELQ